MCSSGDDQAFERRGRSLVLVMSVASTAREGVSGMRITGASAARGDCVLESVIHKVWRMAVRESKMVEGDGNGGNEERGEE